MKGLILSGGKGTRLRPITYTGAKQLIPVANKPVLFYGIEAIKEAGINEIGIIVGDTASEVKQTVGDGSKWGLNIVYIQQEAPLGLAHAVKIAQDYIGNDDFIMYLGDNLIKSGVTSIVKEFQREKPDSSILLSKVPNPQQFGVAQLDSNGNVLKLIEKPKEPPSNLALVGVYLFNKNIFKAVNSIKPSARGELEITDAIQWLIENNYKVKPHIIKGWWKDTGKKDDMLEANRIMLDNLELDINGIVDSKSIIHGNVVIGEGSKIENSTIRGPVIIGKNVKIIDSYLGPYTSISDSVVIKSSEIEHSIILENSKILDINGRIEDSLIGKNVEVKRVESKPKAYKFMLGDQSEVDII